MAKFKDKDEFLDALWEHLELEENDEDTGFFEHLANFFNDDSNDNSGGNQNQGTPNRPRRRSRPTSQGSRSRRPRASSGDSSFGNNRWFNS